eukprot:7210830-Prymnesium_polylepis.1
MGLTCNSCVIRNGRVAKRPCTRITAAFSAGSASGSSGSGGKGYIPHSKCAPHSLMLQVLHSKCSNGGRGMQVHKRRIPADSAPPPG